MKACDKCHATENVADVHARVDETTRTLTACGELCEECRDGLTAVLENAGLRVTPTVHSAAPTTFG